MPTIHRVHVSLLVKKSKVPEVITFLQAVHTAMSTNMSLFPAPSPALTVFAGQIATLVAAQQAITTRAANAVAARNAARDRAWLSLESLRAYVQSVCDASPDQAVFLIKSAGMNVASTGVAAKPVLAAKIGTTPGTVILRANRKRLVGTTSRKITLNWQHSADGGHTWLSGGATPLAHTQVSGLTPLTTYLFRVSATVGETTGEWSQAVNLIVH